MLLPGTQMHIVTFIFVSIEIVIFFYLVIYRLARPDDKQTFLNVILISLLIVYNVTGGLLPDPNLPGSVFAQEVIAYATGFIVPCYFPYYVYKGFGLEKMKFHAYKGVYIFLMLPYILFVMIYYLSGNIMTAKNLFVVAVLYGLWILISLYRSVRFKYQNDFSSKEAKEEVTVLFLSLTPWIGLPFIDYFQLGQAAEASITNVGFLLLLALHVKKNVRQIRNEHQRLIDSELRLMNWNTNLQNEVNKRTKELEKINEQKTNTFVNLAHETKTPLTLINNYLEEYIHEKGNSEELSIVKRSIDKLSTDMINLFDLERFNKGLVVYDHDLVSNFSEIVEDAVALFRKYTEQRGIQLVSNIEDDIFIKADPIALNRIVNNLIENAIKFSNNESKVEVSLTADWEKANFIVKDYGVGIPTEMQKKIFEPYYQISSQKRNIQGMGLGLPIVKKVVDDLKGEIKVESNSKFGPGTSIKVVLSKHLLSDNDKISSGNNLHFTSVHDNVLNIQENKFDESKPTVLVVEDNITMVNYLSKKLNEHYNVYVALNGNEALKKLRDIPIIPDLIISDVMMDKVDGFSFAKIISKDPQYNYIPFIFLSAKSTKQDKLLGLKLGAVDFIQKPFSILELIQKADSILANAARLKTAFLSQAFKVVGTKDTGFSDTITNFDRNANLYNLTAREKEIAKLICQGYTYKVVGEKLFIAERTVTKHVQNIFEKAEVKNKVELINKLENAELNRKL